MKKLVLLFSAILMASAMSFAQYCEITVPDVDVTGLNPGDPVVVPVTLVAHDDLVMGWEFYILFDDTYLSWAPGFLQNKTTLFPGGWFEGINDAGGGMWEFAANWLDPFFTGVDVPDGTLLFELHLTYDGGLAEGDASPLTWNYSKKEVSNFQVKGVTAVVNSSFGFFDNLVTNDGSIFTAAAAGKTWNGSVVLFDIYGSWNDPANWTPAGVPSGTDDVTIPAGTPFSPICHDFFEVEANNLAIDLGATLTLDWNGYLTTNGDLTNNGTFVILTEETTTPFPQGGSYINVGAIGGTGNFESTRNVVCTGAVGGSSNPAGWHYLSAPFDGFTTDDLPNYFVNAWDQATGMWMQYSMDPYTNPCEAWPTTDLLAADAWSINADADYDFNYNDPNNPCFGLLAPTTGTSLEFSSLAAGVHTGTYTVPLGYGAAGFEMFELVGNPYPSGVELSNLVWGPNTQQSVYLWLGCDADYFEWTSALGPQPIGINQGFFVQTTGAGGSIEFNDAARAHGGLGFTKSEITDLLTLEASGNDASDLLHVRFMDGMTAGNDLNGDAPKLLVETEGLPQIYTTALGEKMAINALPATPVVPMGFTSVTSGEYTISAIETSEFANVVLEDRFTGEQTDLLTGSYTFNYTVDDDADRFFIHFTPLGIGDNLANSIDIWSNDHKIYVQAPEINGDIVVFNMMGQEVIRTEIEPGLNTIPVNDRNSYYVVKVVSSDVARTGKVYVK